MNIWVNQRAAGYMPMNKWAECYRKTLPEVKKTTPVGGLDLSATIDLCSFAIEIPLPDDMYYVFSHSFLPSETLERKRKTDKVPYDLWAKDDFITITDGAEVDYHQILEYIVRLYEEKEWHRGEICFDKALATWLMQELSVKKFIPVEIPQSYTGLSLSTKDFRAKVFQKKIIHDGNPVLTWALSNCVTRSGPSENIMLDKARARQRIDPVAALINAHARAMLRVVIDGYQKRGMRSLSGKE
jgi:phage terminase large subunit-like protein